MQGVGLFLVVGTLLFAPSWGWLRALLSSPPARLGGRLSYSLYLWHWIVIAFALLLAFGRMDVSDATQGRWLALHSPWIAALSFGAAWLSYTYVERPMLALRRRWGSRTVAG